MVHTKLVTFLESRQIPSYFYQLKLLMLGLIKVWFSAGKFKSNSLIKCITAWWKYNMRWILTRQWGLPMITQWALVISVGSYVYRWYPLLSKCIDIFLQSLIALGCFGNRCHAVPRRHFLKSMKMVRAMYEMLPFVNSFLVIHFWKLPAGIFVVM